MHRSFVIHLDEELDQWMHMRAAVSGRSFSAEMIYVLQASLERAGHDDLSQDLRSSHAIKRSFYADLAIIDTLRTLAATQRRPVGRIVNMLIRAHFDSVVRSDLSANPTSQQVARSGL